VRGAPAHFTVKPLFRTVVPSRNFSSQVQINRKNNDRSDCRFRRSEETAPFATPLDLDQGKTAMCIDLLNDSGYVELHTSSMDGHNPVLFTIPL
jgi:hypothetical protein